MEAKVCADVYTDQMFAFYYCLQQVNNDILNANQKPLRMICMVLEDYKPLNHHLCVIHMIGWILQKSTRMVHNFPGDETEIKILWYI